MSEQFGKTWWGQQWLQALNNIDYSNRLPRGASYARKGAVKQVKIEANRIHAKVAGSRPAPYKVDLILPPFFEPEVSVFIDAILTRPLLISRLLNRILDPALLEMAERAGLKVFPRQWTDFKMQCSCPDWAVPCKHLASVIYKMSTEIDNNPFLVFELHLLDLIGELTKRGVYLDIQSVEIQTILSLLFEKSKTKVKQNIIPFDPLRAYQKLSFTELTPIHEPLLSLLSAHPVFYSSTTNFKDKYTTYINRIVRSSQRVLNGKLSFAALLEASDEVAKKVSTHSANRVSIDEDFRAMVRVNDDRFSVREFMLELSRLPGNKTSDYQPSTAALHTLFYLALHLTANGAVVPQIVMQPNKKYAIRWLPALISREVRALVDKLSDILPPHIFLWHTGKSEKSIEKNIAVNLLSVFITELVSLYSSQETDDVFLNLFFRKGEYQFNGVGENGLAGGIQTWLQKYYLTQGTVRPQLAVSEISDERFLIEVSVSGLLPEPQLFVPLKEILSGEDYQRQRFHVLQTMATLSDFVPGLEAYINSNGNETIVMDNETFTPFLFQMIPVIRLLDIDLLLPKSLRQILKPKPSVKVKAQPGKSFLNMQQLLAFEWQVALGETVLDEKDFRKLLNKADGLLKYKSQYIYVGKEELEKLYRHFSNSSSLTAFELLRVVLSGEYEGAKIGLDTEVQRLIKELTQIEEVPLPRNLRAELRPYQHRGYSWMYRNSKIGFGSVLADDMGLGKTLQVIATLQKYKEEGMLEEKKVLVVAPTGLLTNWLSEIEKFAPDLKAALFHGTGRKLVAEYDVLLTSYGIARTEAAQLRKLPWRTIVIDEAQNIKNYETAQAKAVKSLKADNYIAMSGTPVENRLSELWSIMDYSNRGFLGSPKEFKETFSIPIETYNDVRLAEKLKKITGPFMMRRLKTDRSIIRDLPDKIEMDTFGVLALEQAALYQKTLEEALIAIEAIDSVDSKDLFVRQGLVLQMILALKQICNHPTQYLKNKRLEASLSGKMELLFSKLDSIVESGEKVLIFTQFKEMGDLLKVFIEERYQEAPMFYHGGCTLKQRKEMVQNFQTNPADKIFILSLKAAGTGLNLTAASHVIHYDLWWNPAVEAQATDRAYRIGQKSNVMVHRFIMKNTFEERINEMIQSKKALAEMSVSTGENWVGNLSNKELREMFTLN